MKIIYIIGAGRSGSTILDVVLGNHSNVAGLGELWAMLEPDHRSAGACSCGAEFRACIFWKSVLDTYRTKLGSRTIAEVRKLRLRLDLARHIPSSFLKKRSRQFQRYASDNRALYEAIAEESGCEFLVDSTKQVGRGLNLLRCEQLDVYLLHLVRDGRGVMWSRQRDDARGEVFRHQALRRLPSFSIAKWTAKNMLSEAIGMVSPERYLRIQYEDLVGQPQTTLAQIGSWCDLDVGELVQSLDNEIAFSPGHQIGGNLRARTKSQTIRLRPDMSWSKNMPPKLDQQFWRYVGWYAKHLGYSRRRKQV